MSQENENLQPVEYTTKRGDLLPDSTAECSIEAMSMGIKRRGTMNTKLYELELIPRTDAAPNTLGLDNAIINIAKGSSSKTFENPQQLAVALIGFEDWCKDKNVVPSFAGVCTFLHISKSTLLKLLKDTTQYTIMIIQDTFTEDYIFSTVSKSKLDKYIDVYKIVDSNTGETISVKECIENGTMEVVYKSVSFKEVLEPIFSTIELITTNKAWDMKNPSWPIFLAKNKFGATEQYTDRQEIAVQASNPIDDMDDAEILKVAQSLPDDL